MPQQFSPFSYADVVRTGEAVRGSRTRNALAQQQLDPGSTQNQLAREQLTGTRQRNVLAQQEGERRQTEFGQEQKQYNTEFLYKAMTIMANDPAQADRLYPELKQMKIIGADFDHTRMSPEEIQSNAAQQAQALGKALGKTKEPKLAGTAMERSRNVYGNLTKKIEDGGELTQSEEIAYGNAVSALQQERLRLDPQGNLTSFRPELPSYDRKNKAGGKIIAESRKVRADKNKITRIKKLAKEVRSLVEKGRNEPFYKRPTGPAGYITSKTQGLRDLGVPVPRAGFETSKRIEEINFLLAPYISGEKGRGISNYDRQRIEKLLGSIDSPLKFDADAVLSAMDIVDSYGNRLEDETYQRSEKDAPESLREGEEGEFEGKKYRRVEGKLQVWEN